MQVGLQLYTVRDECQRDFRGTLRAIADMGYQGVEFAWQYGDMAPDALARFLKELGLACCGWHAPMSELLDAGSTAYAYAKGLGSRYVTTSMAGDVAKHWDEAILKAARAGELASRQGVAFSYHHHAEEFARIDGEYALDRLLRQTVPRQVLVELDTHWILKGGEDPVRYIRKYAGRSPQVHVKDFDPVDGSVTEVGSGSLDVPGVFAAAREAGAPWMIVEQDHSKRTPLESVRMSIEYLKRERLV